MRARMLLRHTMSYAVCVRQQQSLIRLCVSVSESELDSAIQKAKATAYMKVEVKVSKL